MEKIKTGSIYEIAEVLRDLFLLKVDKELSFGERKMLDTARGLLIKELALAKKINEKKVETEVKDIFGLDEDENFMMAASAAGGDPAAGIKKKI
jgi:CarD family transcriptional regulator